MNKILNWFTRRRILIYGFVSAVFFLIFSSRDFIYNTCLNQRMVCYSFAGYLLLIFLFFTTILIPTTISLLFKKEVFYSWRRTIIIYLTIYLIIILVTPWRGGDVYFRIEKDMFALYLSIIYFVYSILFLIYQSFKK